MGEIGWQALNGKKLVVALAALGLAVTGATVFYSINQANQADTEEVATPQITTPAAVTALGRIEPQGEIIQLSPSPDLGGSKLQQLLVEAGEGVQANQIVAILDNYDLRKAEVEVAQQQVEVARANLAIVKAGAKTGEIQAQQAEIERLEAQLTNERQENSARIARLQAQLQRQRQEQAAQIERSRAELSNAEVEFQRYQQLAADGAISASTLDQKRLTLETARERVREAEAAYNKTIDTLEAEIDEATATANKSEATLTAAISQAEAELDRIAEVRPVDVAKAEAELEQAIASYKQAQIELTKTEVKSPITGEVLKINARPGETIDQSEGILELGNTDQMIMVAEVYESDINQVRLGQRAVITSEGGAFTGELQGTVVEIVPQIGKRDVLDTDPAADVDVRVVEVKIALDQESSQQVAHLTNATAIAKILLEE